MEKPQDKNFQDNDEISSHLGEMTSKVSFIFITNFIGFILGYIIIFLASRFIGTEEFGMVIFGWSFAGLFSFAFDMGFSRAHVKRVSEGKNEEKMVPVFAVIKLILTGIMTAVIFVVLLLWEFLGGGYENPELKKIIYIILSYFVLTNIGSIFVQTYIARRDAIRTQLCPIFEVLSRCLAVIVVATFALGALGLAVTWFIAGVAYFIAAIALYKGPHLQFPNRSTFWEVSSSYLVFALPLSISIGVAAGSQYFDKILIQLFLSSEDVTFFYVPQRLMLIFLSLGSAIALMLFPLLSEINSKKNRDYASRIASRAMFYISLVILPVASFFFAFSEPILRIFISSDFVVVETTFRILIIAYVLGVLLTPANNLLLGMEKSKIVARLGIIFSILVITIDLILIPSERSLPFSLGVGITGAAISLLIAYLFLFVGTMWEVRRAVKFSISNSILPIALISAISSVGPFYLYSILGANRFWDVLGYFGANIVIFILLILVMRVISWSELKKLLAIFSPKKFIGFLRS